MSGAWVHPPSSIVRLSRYHSPDPHRRYMALQAFYDGGGASHDSFRITLAGLAAPEEVWSRFDALWLAALECHHLDWWHTTDAMRGEPQKAIFVKPQYRDSWDRAKALAAFSDLNRLVREFAVGERENGFQVLVCTVEMAGYRAAKARNPDLRPAEAICVDHCVGGLALHEPGASIQIVFDRNEMFQRHMYQVWDRNRRKATGWPRQVRAIATGLSKDTNALQAADLAAWRQNRALRDDPSADDWANAFGQRLWYYDQEAIESAYPPDRERGRLDRFRDAGIRNAETGERRPKSDGPGMSG